MTTPPVSDAWNEGQSYERYMGRWSRQMAPLFVDWLDQPPDRDWADIGCGTGALASTILARCQPRSVVGIDASASFVEHANGANADPRASFLVGTASNLGFANNQFDVVASALAYNFFPDRPAALAEMRRVARPDGVVAFYVWDYPGGGREFIEAFWQAARTIDPAAAEHDESRRFQFCTPGGLAIEVEAAGLTGVEVSPLNLQIRFESFDDFWEPFTLGAGPAPAYYAQLASYARTALEERLRQEHDRAGPIDFGLRAWAVRGRAD